MKSRGSKLSIDRVPLRTEEPGDYEPSRQRIPAARQLCHGSNRELPARPALDKCPVCEKRVEVVERATGYRDPKTRDMQLVYTIPSHLEKRQ